MLTCNVTCIFLGVLHGVVHLSCFHGEIAHYDVDAKNAWLWIQCGCCSQSSQSCLPLLSATLLEMSRQNIISRPVCCSGNPFNNQDDTSQSTIVPMERCQFTAPPCHVCIGNHKRHAGNNRNHIKPFSSRRGDKVNVKYMANHELYTCLDKARVQGKVFQYR